MKIASYNIRKCIGLDRRRDPKRVLSVIKELPVDVIALQEVDKRLGKRPSSIPFDQIEIQTGMQPITFDRSGSSLGWHGNTFLVKSNVSITDIECIDLPGLEPRGAIIAEVHLSGTTPFQLIATHLGLLRKNRIRQLTYIQDALANRTDLPTIIMGDFNEWSQTAGLAAITNKFNILAPGNSFHAARPIAKLDRFALSKNLHVKDAGVLTTRLARKASDHLPIWAEVVQA